MWLEINFWMPFGCELLVWNPSYRLGIMFGGHLRGRLLENSWGPLQGTTPGDPCRGHFSDHVSDHFSGHFPGTLPGDSPGTSGGATWGAASDDPPQNERLRSPAYLRAPVDVRTRPPDHSRAPPPCAVFANTPPAECKPPASLRTSTLGCGCGCLCPF